MFEKVPGLGDRRRFLLPSSEMQLHGSNVFFASFYWHSVIIARRKKKKGKMQLEKTEEKLKLALNFTGLFLLLKLQFKEFYRGMKGRYSKC